MDDMAIIDDMAMFAAALGAAARKRKERCAAEEQLKPIVVKSHSQSMADQPRRHGVEHLAQREPARGGHHDKHLFIIAGAHRSEEHTSELQSLMRISYAVFCLKKTTSQ